MEVNRTFKARPDKTGALEGRAISSEIDSEVVQRFKARIGRVQTLLEFLNSEYLSFLV